MNNKNSKLRVQQNFEYQDTQFPMNKFLKYLLFIQFLWIILFDLNQKQVNFLRNNKQIQLEFPLNCEIQDHILLENLQQYQKMDQQEIDLIYSYLVLRCIQLLQQCPQSLRIQYEIIVEQLRDLMDQWKYINDIQTRIFIGHLMLAAT
ncbi:hypothetical protein pb186bvf_005198 [Paramecium bursaria]